MKKTFYVLREPSTPFNPYRRFDPTREASGVGVRTAQEASQFQTAADALLAIQTYTSRGSASYPRRLDIIRVTETPAGPSTTTLREVPLGSKEQMGVVIKSDAFNDYLTLEPPSAPRASRTEFLDKATVFTNIEQALLIMQRACRDSGARGSSTIVSATATLVGVAQETVTAPATYDVVVLA